MAARSRREIIAKQGRSQNLKEVPQNFTEIFNIDGVTANDVIQRNLFECFYDRFQKASKCPVWYSMMISSHIHNPANRAIAKNS